MSFRDDYFRRLLERLNPPVEEREAQGDADRLPDTIDHLDRAVALKYRDRSGVLSLSPTTTGDGPDDQWLRLRTQLGRRLQASGLHEDIVLFLLRSLLVGLEDLDAPPHQRPGPASLLAGLLRQERVGRMIPEEAVAEAWRVLFELQWERESFANAENALFHALNLADAPESLLRRGLDFYDDLVDRPPEDLRRGGLTHAEADHARWELVKHLADTTGAE
jgi:hypothetical protein